MKRTKAQGSPQTSQVSDAEVRRHIVWLQKVGEVREGVSERRQLPVENTDHARFRRVEDLPSWRSGKIPVALSESS